MIDQNAFQQGYPGYNFMQGMAGPSGFSGQMQQQGMLPQFDQTQQQHSGHHGMNPLMMLSPIMGAFASGHPNIGLSMISPGLGIARALGLFK